YVAANGKEPEPVRVRVSTGEDGVFEVRFAPPPASPWHYSLYLATDGRVGTHTNLGAIEPGAEVDLGDRVLVPGAAIEGRVVDENGQPLADISLAFEATEEVPSGAGVSEPVQLHGFQSKQDGSIPRSSALLPGTYAVKSIERDYRLVEPKQVVLVRERPIEFVTVVMAETDAPRIRGRVVDENGQPVDRAEVEAFDARTGDSKSTRSKRDGTFVLVGRENATQPPVLTVRKEGFETSEKSAPIAWGSKDVELRILRGLEFTVQVTDASGKPVTDYTVHHRLVKEERLSSIAMQPRKKGPHENGVCVLKGMPRGLTIVAVGFGGDEGNHPFVEFVDIGTTRRLDLVAGPVPERVVRVVDGAGVPVVGTYVELRDGLGAGTWTGVGAFPWSQWTNHGGAQFFAPDASTTGEDGRCTLRTRVHRELDLHVLGPGHQPIEVRGVRMSAGGELDVRVSRGARLAGRITPADGLDLLVRLAADAREDSKPTPASVFRGSRRPTVMLLGAPEPWVPYSKDLLHDEAGPPFVRNDGTFDVTGLPPGPWRVVLRYTRTSGDTSSTKDLEVADVTLIDGETVTLDIDVSSLEPGRVEGVLRWNGAPPPEGASWVLRKQGGWLAMPMGPGGTFAADAADGTWHAVLSPPGRRLKVPQLRSATPVVVRRGETTKVELDFYSGVVAVTVLDADGKPVPGFRLKSDEDVWWPNADANGRIEFEVTARVHRLLALPWSLQQPGAMDKLRADTRARGEPDPWDKVFREVGTVTAIARQRVEVEVKLPRE
ncbi:MAG: carboxypeptidase-like regulatory domain-containing protein, partial [Planctomycetota bacterium]